jgi:hypothetical protein
MSDHHEKLKSATSASEAERRAEDRQSFTAAADVVELRTGALFSTRTTDLGAGGCFVDTLVPFEAGSKVGITIREGKTRFEATGIVVYSQSGLGMGIAFDDLKPEQRKALSFCLGEDTGQHEEKSVAKLAGAKPMLPHGSEREAMVRLVRLMIAKGLLTEGEATAIFANPVLF